jgi:hypothetical protein
MESTVRGSPFGLTNNNTPRTAAQLLAKLRTKIASLQLNLSTMPGKQREFSRWKWGVRQLYEQWWDSLESFLVAVGFAHRDEENKAVYYPDKLCRLYNNDETAMPMGGKDREGSGPGANVFVDSTLPRPGAREAKVRARHVGDCLSSVVRYVQRGALTTKAPLTEG